jgi:hypothetical protein
LSELIVGCEVTTGISPAASDMAVKDSRLATERQTIMNRVISHSHF